MVKKLYRSISDRRIAGVCGGLAPYLDVDVTVVRLVWLLLTLLAGLSFWVYVIFWIVVPNEPAGGSTSHYTR